MREFINIIETAQNEGPEGYPHYAVHEDLMRLANKYRTNSKGAAEYYHTGLAIDENEAAVTELYERTILPILEQFGFPIPSDLSDVRTSEAWGEFQQFVIRRWAGLV